MGKVIQISLILVLSYSLKAQLLNIEQTATFLGEYLTDQISRENNFYGGQKVIDFRIESSDVLTIRYHWKGAKDVLFPDYRDKKVDYNEFQIDINAIASLEKEYMKNVPVILLKCKDGTKNCVTMSQEAIMWHYGQGYVDRPNAINHFNYIHLFYLPNEKVQSTMYNGLIYMLYEMSRMTNVDEYENPFSDKNVKFNSNNKEVVTLGRSGGVSTLTIEIGGIEAKVILDSGASDVSIPKNLEKMLLRREIITTDSYLMPGIFVIADGSVVSGDRFIVPSIKVNGIAVNNVQCSVNQSEDMILLGQTFLNRFKSWTIDNDLNQLILEY